MGAQDNFDFQAERRLPPELEHMLRPQRLPFHEAFKALEQEAQRFPDCYDNPALWPPNQTELYDLALRANLINIAREMARSWGEEDSDGPLLGFDSLRCWPHAESRGPHRLRLSFGRTAGGLKVAGLVRVRIDEHSRTEVRDQNNQLVLTDHTLFIRPGSWIQALQQEYERFRSWRNENDEVPGSSPKPLAPLRLT